MLEFYEWLAARLQRAEPLLSIAAVALFVAVAVMAIQSPESPEVFQVIQLSMLWVCGLAVVSRLFNPEPRESSDGGRVMSYEQARAAARNWCARHIIDAARRQMDDSPFMTAGPACGRI